MPLKKNLAENDGQDITRFDYKQLGAVDTPQIITGFICRKLIVDFLNAKLNVELNAFNNIFQIRDQHLLRKILRILDSIKILDPAVGKGNFLFEMISILIKIYEYVRSIGLIEKELFEIKKEIITNNLFGIDLDEQAIKTCKKQLKYLFFGEVEEKDLMFIDEAPNIAVGNSFSDNMPFLKFEYFDIVMGNPPYIPWRNIKPRNIFESGSYLGCSYKARSSHPDAQPNLYLFFLVLGLKLLKKDGILSYILPQEWLFHLSTTGFRDFLIKMDKHIDLLLFNEDFKIFRVKDRIVGTNSLIITVNRKSMPNDIPYIHLFDLRETPIPDIIKFLKLDLEKKSVKPQVSPRKLALDAFLNKKWVFLGDIERSIREEILKLDDLMKLDNPKQFLIKGGFQPPVDFVMNIFHLRKSLMNQIPSNERKYVFPVIVKASNMKKYELPDPQDYWIVLNKEFETERQFQKNCPKLYSILSQRVQIKSGNWWEFPNVRNLEIIKQNPLKIVTPRTAEFNSFALDDQTRVLRGTNSIIIPRQLDPYYVLSIMNSKLAAYWYDKFGHPYHGGKTKKFEPDKLKKYFLPIRVSSTPAVFSKCARFLMNYYHSKKENPNLEAGLDFIEKEILDNMVFELYFQETTGSNLSSVILNIWEQEISELSPESVNEFAKRFYSNKIIQNELEKIKQHEYYREIMNNL